MVRDRTVQLCMRCFLTISIVYESFGQSQTIGFNRLPCELFKNERKLNFMLSLSLVPKAAMTSVLTCLACVALNDSLTAPGWALISGSSDMKSLQCQSLMFTSPDSDIVLLTESDLVKEANNPFCEIYFTSGESCKTSLRTGWTTPPVIIWSGDLETWANCDNVKDGGGWTVIQRRQDGSVDFYKGWQDYKSGFGSLTGEFWWGLENIRRFLALRKCQLRFDMTRDNGERYFAVYDDFEIAEESDNYRLTVSSFSGNAGDGFSYHSGATFETRDRMSSWKCPEKFGGGFWYRTCHATNPNGFYGSEDYGKGINWKPITSFAESLPFFEMKIRPLE